MAVKFVLTNPFAFLISFFAKENCPSIDLYSPFMAFNISDVVEEV